MRQRSPVASPPVAPLIASSAVTMEPRPLLPIIPELLYTSFRVGVGASGGIMDSCDVAAYEQWLNDTQICEALIFGGLLEPLSRTPPWLPAVVWLPVAVAAANRGASLPDWNPSALSLVAAALAGVFLWTLIEYCIHRFAFHFASHYKRLTAWGLALHFLVHGVHHRFAHDAARLVFPPGLTLPIVLLVATLLGLPVAPTPWTWCVLAGGLVSYVAYDLMHYL